MRGNELLDRMELAASAYIEAAGTATGKKKNHWVKWGALAACLCLCLVGAFHTLQRFDYFQGVGCSAMPGTIVDGSYYYNVKHSGVWKYSDGNTEKVLSTYWEDGGWLVNEFGMYYSHGRNLYRMDLDSQERTRIFSAPAGAHISYDLTQDGNVVVTVYGKNLSFEYQVLVDGTDGGVIEELTEKTSYDPNAAMYTELHYELGDRKIELIQSGGDAESPYYVPVENEVSLLPEGKYVSPYGSWSVDGALFLEVYQEGQETQEEPEMLILFADGKTVLETEYVRYSGAIGHILLYVDGESAENYGSNGSGIWCCDTDSGEKWQLTIDAESEFYEFTNDDRTLYSCVAWSEEQTAWKIVYEGDRPVSLKLIDDNIIG